MALPDVQAAHPQAPALVRQQQRDDHDRHQHHDGPQRELSDSSRHVPPRLSPTVMDFGLRSGRCNDKASGGSYRCQGAWCQGAWCQGAKVRVPGAKVPSEQPPVVFVSTM